MTAVLDKSSKFVEYVNIDANDLKMIVRREAVLEDVKKVRNLFLESKIACYICFSRIFIILVACFMNKNNDNELMKILQSLIFINAKNK